MGDEVDLREEAPAGVGAGKTGPECGFLRERPGSLLARSVSAAAAI
jgi:hypothetical protein